MDYMGGRCGKEVAMKWYLDFFLCLYDEMGGMLLK